ncbi:hypothetical protein [Streptomyces sannanensis]|uniref:hypothetical protein n=1 Tax=Streptomyces sannanensis TaxID=285536 RepID=UPI003CD082B2
MPLLGAGLRLLRGQGAGRDVDRVPDSDRPATDRRLEAAATKPYGFTSFRPGPDVDGHCIPADPLYLVHHVATMGLPFHMAETAHQVNDGMPLWVSDRIVKELEASGTPADTATVLLLGVCRDGPGHQGGGGRSVSPRVPAGSCCRPWASCPPRV